jgi:hypothetical protein
MHKSDAARLESDDFAEWNGTCVFFVARENVSEILNTRIIQNHHEIERNALLYDDKFLVKILIIWKVHDPIKGEQGQSLLSAKSPD